MVRRYISQRSQWIRAYYSRIGKSGVILPAAFLIAVVIGMVVLGLVFYSREVFLAPPGAIGVLAGTWSLAYVSGCLFLRPLFGRVLPRHLIAGSNIVTALSVLGMLAAPRFGWLFVWNALFGLSISLFWPPLMGWLSADMEGKQLGRVVNRFNAAWCTGNLISPYLCGWLSEMNPAWPLLAAGLIAGGTAVYVMAAGLILPRVRADRPMQEEPANGVAPGRETSLRYPAWVGLFACFFAMGTLSAVFPLDAQEALGFSKSLVGGLFFVRGAFNIAGFVVLGRTDFWHFKAYPMLIWPVGAALLCAGLAVFDSTVSIAVLLGGIGLASAMAYSASIFHGASGSRNRAKRMAIHEAVLAAGVMSGSVIGGLVYQSLSASHAYALCAALLLAALGIQAILVCGRPIGSSTPAEPV